MNNLFEKINEKNKYLGASAFLIFVMVMLTGISYAMYTFVGTGTKENVITTGQIEVSFEEKNNIIIKNRYPETDAVGLANTDPNSQMTFTVSSDIVGDAIVNYAIGLVDIKEGATLKQNNIKIYLTKNGQVANEFTENKGKTINSFSKYSVTNYLDSHVIAKGGVTSKQIDTYTLKAWINENYNLPLTNKDDENTHSNTSTTETFSFKIKVVATDNILNLKNPTQLDESGANPPVLVANMIPVYYEDGKWKKADTRNKDEDYKWYDYNNKMWANAVTVSEVDGSRDDLVDAEVGTVIPMERINTMMVWIPRFSATGDTADYNGGTIDAPGAFDITFVNITVAAHDAFDFGGSISGFWIGKFENSINITCSQENMSELDEGCNLTSVRPKVLPNATSWRGASISTFFYSMQKMTDSNNQYGFDKTIDPTLDTHMLKNNEWGAVAYLTQSIYGRCSSSTSCAEVGVNNNLLYTTGYGAKAGSASTVINGPYQTIQGQDASTTGNIYGVYDMSGGAFEYVMGNYNNTLNGDQFNILPDTKYYSVYSTQSSYTNDSLQHAMIETSTWYGDSSTFIKSEMPWVSRGGGYSNAAKSGVFSFSSDNGASSILNGSRFSATIS